MNRYRKRPVVVEAMQFVGGAMNAGAIIQWVSGVRYYPHRDERRAGNGEIWQSYDPEHLTIRTMEGVMRAELGDWIIRGTRGEVYPCKPGPFEDTFELLASGPVQREQTRRLLPAGAVVAGVATLTFAGIMAALWWGARS